MCILGESFTCHFVAKKEKKKKESITLNLTLKKKTCTKCLCTSIDAIRLVRSHIYMYERKFRQKSFVRL